MIYKLLLTILLSISSLFSMDQIAKDSHKIDLGLDKKCIISFSEPCCGSVAFLRMMRQRKDFFISHEPGVYTWIKHKYPDKIDVDSYQHRLENFADVQEFIDAISKEQNSFIKEECYAAYHYVYDSCFIKSAQTYSVFLIRNPHDVLLSLYFKINRVPEGIVDYEKTWEMYSYIKSLNANVPYIICFEDLTEHPKRIVKKFCNHVNIPFIKESLKWEDLSDNFEGLMIWHDTSYARFDSKWHGNALRSTSFTKLEKEYVTDNEGKPTFEEIEDEELCSQFLEFYEKMLPFYEQFLNEYRVQYLESLSNSSDL